MREYLRYLAAEEISAFSFQLEGSWKILGRRSGGSEAKLEHALFYDQRTGELAEIIHISGTILGEDEIFAGGAKTGEGAISIIFHRLRKFFPGIEMVWVDDGPDFRITIYPDGHPF
jgi:hypothetical protein